MHGFMRRIAVREIDMGFRMLIMILMTIFNYADISKLI